MRVLFIISAILVITLVVMFRCHKQKNEPIVIESHETSETKTQDHEIDSLSKKLQVTIDSFNRMKPVVEMAIKKLRFYDSIRQNVDSVLLSTERLKRDLYEARLEITRLAAPREYRITWKKENQ